MLAGLYRKIFDMENEIENHMLGIQLWREGEHISTVEISGMY